MTSTTQQGRLLLKPGEAAQALAVSERTLWQYTTPRGPIPCCKIGSSIRYRLMDLENYLTQAVEVA